VTDVVFIGLGRMGLPMAMRLLAAGHQVAGYDIDHAATASFAAAGGRVAQSAAAAAASADAVVLMLPSSTVVDQVLLDDGLLASLRAGQVVIDMSSSDPLHTRRLAHTAAERSIHLVDAPVSGGVPRAISGQLTIMVGGDDVAVGLVRPLLEAMGGQISHLGPVGAGHAVKALNNLLGATSLLIASEALEVGRAFGLDLELLVETFNASTGRSWSTEHKLPTYVLTEAFDSGFDLALMVKDVQIARSLALSVGVVDGVTERTVDVWTRAMAELDVDADHTEIARWLRRQVPVAGAANEIVSPS